MGFSRTRTDGPARSTSNDPIAVTRSTSSVGSALARAAASGSWRRGTTQTSNGERLAYGAGAYGHPATGIKQHIEQQQHLQQFQQPVVFHLKERYLPHEGPQPGQGRGQLLQWP